MVPFVMIYMLVTTYYYLDDVYIIKIVRTIVKLLDKNNN
jgi:hypothetical protein